MTQRLPMTFRKLLGNFFIILVILTILFIYSEVMQTYTPMIKSIIYSASNVKLYLVTFHTFFIMLIWAFIRTMTTDPGLVPPLWGFYMGDSEQKRKRYCLMCHVFKPERCHHCSVCNRCVLNMDHHCPWLNNCIGFFNRKFFILLLTYALFTLWLASFGLFPRAFTALENLASVSIFSNLSEIYKITVFTFTVSLTVVLTLFYKFHLVMLVSNLSTIENMDKRNLQSYRIYDKGAYLNFVQVFGGNPWLWALPVNGKSGMPVGDGVVWRQMNVNVDEDLPGTDEYVKSTQRNQVLGSAFESFNASRDLISPRKDDLSKRDTDQTLNSFRGHMQSLNESSQL